MGSDEAAELKFQRVRTNHEQRNKHHGVRHELRRDGDEEEVGLDAALILRPGVGQGQNEALQVEARVEAQEGIERLR